MQTTAVLRVLTGILLASTTVFACGDDSAPRPVSTRVPIDPSSVSPVDPPPLTEEARPTFPSDPRIGATLVEDILPAAAETSATVGVRPGAWTLSPGPGALQDLNLGSLDVVAAGVTAFWSAGWSHTVPATDAATEGIGVSLVFHRTPRGAERTFQYFRGLWGDQGESERGTIADAVSSVSTGSPTDVPFTFSFIAIRQGTVSAWVGVTHAQDRDVSVDLREFARMLALGIDEFIRSQGP